MASKNQPTLIAIGNKIKQLRKDKGFTSYRNFADQYDIEPKQYWRLEEAKTDLRISSLLRVLEIHEVSLSDFFKDIDNLAE